MPMCPEQRTHPAEGSLSDRCNWEGDSLEVANFSQQKCRTAKRPRFRWRTCEEVRGQSTNLCSPDRVDSAPCPRSRGQIMCFQKQGAKNSGVCVCCSGPSCVTVMGDLGCQPESIWNHLGDRSGGREVRALPGRISWGEVPPGGTVHSSAGAVVLPACLHVLLVSSSIPWCCWPCYPSLISEPRVLAFQCTPKTSNSPGIIYPSEAVSDYRGI